MRSIKLMFITLMVALAVGGLMPTGAQAAQSRSGPECATQSLTVTQLGAEVMVNSHIDNACGRKGWFVILYRLTGPTPHSKIIRIQLPSQPIDVVTFFPTPGSGHYDLRQRVVGHHRELGQTFASFDVT